MKDNYIVALPLFDGQTAGYEQIVYCPEEPESVDKRTNKVDSKSFAEAFSIALKDCKEGRADVIVVSNAGLLSPKAHAFVIYVAGHCRFTSLTNATMPAEAVNSLTLETVVDRLATIAHTLRRDFKVEHPRIALLGIDEQANTILSQAIVELGENHIYAYGPLTADDLNDSEKLSRYDVVVGCLPSQVADMISECTNNMENTAVACLANMSYVCTADIVTAAEEPHHAALYMAIDILCRRHDYDLSHANPLPKLYHEHREDNDRPRFTQKKAEANTNS